MTIYNFINLLISIVTLLIVVRLHRTIIDKVLNNIDLEMSKIAFQEMSSIGNKTKAENAIRSYIRKTLHDVFQKYLQAKSKGIRLINDPAFISDLLGSAEIELNALYDKFPSVFLKGVDELAYDHFQKFKDNLLFDLQASKKNNYKDALKINVLSTIKTFVSSVVALFDDTKHLINDVEFKRHQDKQHFHLSEKSKYFDFETKIIVNKIELKELLSLNNFDKAIDILSSLTNSTLKENQITLLKGRYSEYKSEKISGIESKIVLNKIRTDLLTYIDDL